MISQTYPVPGAEQRALVLQAGRLSLRYTNGALRAIHFGEREVLRMIYVAVRDRNWGTVPALLRNERIEVGEDWFRIRYEAEHRQDAIDFVWHATIIGTADGTIRFEMDGKARSTFLRNRIGFCVLHPIAECAGQPCQVEHVDGVVKNGMFPLFISAHQPFFAMRTITHEVLPQVRAEVRMEGDTFEMEDQRNWTDASFKTYCTPLALPFPVEITAGTRVVQSVELRLHGQPVVDFAPPVHAVELAADGECVPLPPIGLGMASHTRPLEERQITLLRELRLAHVRIDLRLDEPTYPALLRQAASETQALGTQLEVALFLSDNAEQELAKLAAHVREIQPLLARWLVFHRHEKTTGARWMRLARRQLAVFGAPVGGGTDAYFAQLNRERPVLDACDVVSYSINPQVHAFDNTSLMECTATQADTLQSARQFCGQLPIVVSPVTLRPRFNPDATELEPPLAPGMLPPQVDSRQETLFCAAWTVSSLRYLAMGGASSVTYFETSGWRGVIETNQGSPFPTLFRSEPGAAFPVYHVLADLAAFVGGALMPLTTREPLHANGVLLRNGLQRRWLIANTSESIQRIVVRGLPERVLVRMLDQTNVERAAREPHAFGGEQDKLYTTANGLLEAELSPYAVVRVDDTMAAL